MLHRVDYYQPKHRNQDHHNKEDTSEGSEASQWPDLVARHLAQ